MGADQGLSPCLTPGGTVGGFTPTPRERGQKARLGSEVHARAYRRAWHMHACEVPIRCQGSELGRRVRAQG